MSRNATLVYILKDDMILLGTKKYGGAKGILNGFGGKIEEFDKDILEAAKREVVEETSLELKTVLTIGVLTFYWEYKKDSASCYLFKATDFGGEPKESKEMTVEWFSINSVPKNRMWSSDKYWFDYVLQDRPFVIDFHFMNEKSDLFDKMIVNFVKDINEYIPKNN